MTEDTKVMLHARLKRCICGGYGQYGSTYPYLHNNNKCWIYCDKCGVQTKEHNTMAEAINEWNKK